MRIGIDARMLGKGYGLGRYVEELIHHLQIHDSKNEYVIFMASENWDTFIPTSDKWSRVNADIPWYSFKEQLTFPRIIKKAQVDLMHFPHFNVPLLYRAPFVVTIHDLTMFHFPRPEATTHGPLVYWIKDKAHRIVIRRAVRAAQHVITVSEYTKEDVHKMFRTKREKMTTIYQAPFHLEEKEDKKNIPFDPVTYGITKPYVLYVGAAYPHKNLDRLVDAWKQAQEELQGAYQLVLAGKHNYFYKKLLSYIGEDESITCPGFISDQDLSKLYQGAAVFVFPSMSEGFGFPPLEAFVQSTPVIASNATSLPEILGEGAVYVDPTNTQHIADTLVRVLQDTQLQHELVEQGKKEIQKYSWESLAKKTIQVYTKSVQTSS